MNGLSRSPTSWLLLLVVFLWCQSGCAVVFKGEADKLILSSEPEGARVCVGRQCLGTTPLTVELRPQNTFALKFRKAGYQTETFTLRSHVGATWAILDILGGIWPVAADAATGAWLEFDQSRIHVRLESSRADTTANGSGGR
jgi:hypothetical protein